MDLYNVKPAAKTCCQTGHEFQPGEMFYSALFYDSTDEMLIRRDFCAAAWEKVTQNRAATSSGSIDSTDNNSTTTVTSTATADTIPETAALSMTAVSDTEAKSASTATTTEAKTAAKAAYNRNSILSANSAIYAYWRCEVPPLKQEDHSKPATNEQLLEYFDLLRQQPEQADKLFVLTLLLTRRRIFREDETIEFETDDLADELAADSSESNAPKMKVYCPRRDESYTVDIVDILLPRQDEIQLELENLLYGTSEENT